MMSGFDLTAVPMDVQLLAAIAVVAIPSAICMGIVAAITISGFFK